MYGFHSRNHGFLISGMAVSKTPDTGVTEPGILIMASKRREAAHAERVRYNKAYYSLDCDDGIEYSACLHEPSPQELMDRKELFFRLWNALNSLPEIQGRRVDAHLILGKSYRQIAREEGVDKSAVRCSVKCGIERMKKYLQENF